MNALGSRFIKNRVYFVAVKPAPHLRVTSVFFSFFAELIGHTLASLRNSA